jgi:integrase
VTVIKARAMVSINFRYLIQDRDRHGNVRIYLRYAGRKTRMREAIGSAEFVERYYKLLAEAEVCNLATHATSVDRMHLRRGTLAWLSQAYEASTPFRQLEPSTQRTRRRILSTMLDEPIAPEEKETFRNFPLARITTAALAVLRDRKSGVPGAANDRVKVLRALFKWAQEAKHLIGNPAIELVRLRVGKTVGHHTWTLDEIAQFEARHPLGTRARLAMALMLYSGARRSDATRLGRQHMNDGRLRWTAYKNRNRHPVILDIPVLAPLAEAIAAGPTGRLMFLETEFGKSFSIPGFGNWFRDRCDEADLRQCSAHGLRKAGSTLAAENGASAHELMAMFGWSNLAEAEHYTRTADRRRLSSTGMLKILGRT